MKTEQHECMNEMNNTPDQVIDMHEYNLMQDKGVKKQRQNPDLPANQIPTGV